MITTKASRAYLPQGNCLTGFGGDYLYFLVRQVKADCADTEIKNVFGACKIRQRGGLGLTVSDQDFKAVHVVDDSFHQLRRTGCTGNYSFANL